MKIGVLNIFGFVMSVVYTLLGIYLLIQPEVLNFSKLQRIGLGIVFILYGMFRLYKAKNKVKYSGETEE